VLVQGYNGRGPTKCDHCGGRLEKLLSTAAVIYKGSGFYTTDYCRGSNSDGNGEKPKKDWKEKAEEIKSSASSTDDKKDTKAKKKEKAEKK